MPREALTTSRRVVFPADRNARSRAPVEAEVSIEVIPREADTVNVKEVMEMVVAPARASMPCAPPAA